MKKIYYLISLLLVCVFNQLIAQNVTKESCTKVKTNDKYIQQEVIHSDANYTYFTEFEKGKGKNGITSIAKFDKNLNFANRVMLKEYIPIFDSKKDFLDIDIYFLKNRFAIITSKEPEKNISLGWVNSNEPKTYSISFLDLNLNKIVANKELFIVDDEFQGTTHIKLSEDSTKILFYLSRYGAFKDYKDRKDNLKAKCIVVDSLGTKLFNKIIEFAGINEYDNTIINSKFINNEIYFGVSFGYKEITSQSNRSTRRLFGFIKKTETEKYNYQLYKYSFTSGSLNQILKDKNVEENYLFSPYLTSNNGRIYLSGSYTLNKNALALALALSFKSDGHFVITIDANTDKILSSNFIVDEEGQKGDIEEFLFKEDGGYYMIGENNHTHSFSSSDNTYIYNFGTDGQLIWKKAILKEHQAGNLQKGVEEIYSKYFIKNNFLYVLMNENKKNAELPINQKMTQNKTWNKGLYTIAFIYGNNFEKKQIIYNQDEIECGFRTSNLDFYKIHTKYMVDRLNSLYINLKQNKIYSIGGIDDERTISVLNIE